MPDIMVLLACLSQCIEPTPVAPTGAGDRGDAVHERSGDHARPVPLVRQRWQLPDDPTVFQHYLELVPTQLAPPSPSCVGRR